MEDSARLAEGYLKKYKPYVQAFEKSLVAKAMDISEHHIVQLGKQLDAWETYTKILEANGSLNTLGELPKVALDVITATMSNSILPVIASTQVIQQQKQMIYFKNLRAESTKGNLTAGQVIVDPRTGMVTPKGYASNGISAEPVATVQAGQVDFSFTLAAFPIRSQFLKITLEDSTAIYGKDVGPLEGSAADKNVGQILGAGFSGTVNYTTGLVQIKFAVAPTTGKKLFASYQQNLEEATDLPKMTSFLDQTDVEAQAYALKSVVGMFQQFALKQTFGDSALDDMAMELTREINAEIGGDFINKYLMSAMGTTQFKLAPDAGVSEKLHRESYAFRLADSEAVMIGNAGRGGIKVMVVGREHAALVRGLDGFQLLSDGNSLGAHIFGTYKGITYIRVPNSDLMDPKAGVGLYTGASTLESAGVYCPFMPLTITQSVANPLNPLMEQKVAATMAATKVVVPQYATKFNVIP